MLKSCSINIVTQISGLPILSQHSLCSPCIACHLQCSRMVTDDNKYRTSKDKDHNGKKKERKTEIREDFNSENV